jgi:hypothetical protein
MAEIIIIENNRNQKFYRYLQKHYKSIECAPLSEF